MAKDPAFLFYPGDYLRDTQCLSEKAQVAYDRIMCEHMRNICISQQQLNFFTKRLSDDEKNELSFLLKKVEDGFQIEWVAESICKRKEYSESRRKNRKKDMINISSSYDKHMEIENINENEIVNKDSFGKSENLLWDSVKLNFFNGWKWKEKFCIDKSIQMPDLENRMREFISDVELKEDFKELKELKNHFTNWFNKKKNGTTKAEPGGRHKGAMQLIESLRQDFNAGRKADTGT